VDAAALACARLLREGAVPRAELPDLERPEVRHEVEERLASVGLELATSAYSEHVGLRLSPEVTADAAFDAASNVGLRSDACALLAILWARLVLQKRTAEDRHEVPDAEPSLYPEQRAEAARRFIPRVRIETIAREFGEAFSSRSHIKRLVTQLRRLGFLAGRGEVVEAGPLLELGIDGERMVAFIRRNVLAELLRRREGEAAASADEPHPLEKAVLDALAKQGGEARMREIARLTGEDPARLRAVLNELRESGRVRRSGERAQTRYHLVEGEG